jgi:hypothetical protein
LGGLGADSYLDDIKTFFVSKMIWGTIISAGSDILKRFLERFNDIENVLWARPDRPDDDHLFTRHKERCLSLK